jgi:hypothetical protein
MTRIARLIFAVAFIGTLIVSPLLARGVSAQDATPQAVPPPVACWAIEPVDLLDLFNLVDDLDEMSNANAYLTTSVWGPSLQDGDDATAEDRFAVEQTLAAFIACLNDRDPMRLLALMSERYQALMVLDLINGADAMSVIAEQIPDIARSEESTEPISTPEIVRAWRPNGNSTDIWTVVSANVPGQDQPVEFFVAFVPGGDGWVVDYIARYESD